MISDEEHHWLMTTAEMVEVPGTSAAPYFVYRLEGRHLWRFVNFVECASDGDDAIRQSTDLAREMGNDPAGAYMAVRMDMAETGEVR